MTKNQWLDKYEKVLIKYGLDMDFAHKSRMAVDVDLSLDPECAAADEVSYMVADSETGGIGGESYDR